ncbi:MFS multidrug transporter, putative [Penicillium digitatum]|uniref:MFS multidrug transporter, putative n=3 Tax=Penicillium digitatum TaxID=36651 RepID=K9FQK5_PEND2|nr:MFS multidrug transporter, putative [Penicillium digitatum Pd1]EKV11955.1 MFS multidrug transporter, putative [Penicillium digitatum PHI26]EKV20432.1 MFS multidrug transporter, putative [Penicillium digitatum Pd1]KAG0153792.1 hypothetical protein PDIDSM_2447 [Penicillium digitatum]QQK42208.1 MFS multidrug transporter, putative [Penicillium digitatum]
MTATNDGESMLPSKIPFWCLIFDQKVVTEEVMQYSYTGLGTEDDPYAIVWIPEDPRNPMNFRPIKKWSISLLVSFATLAVSLVSSAFSGGMRQIMEDFGASQEIVILGVSLFVLGFAIGPLIWAPLTGAMNIETLIILRFLAGSFGSSPFGNGRGTIADMFPASQRGIAISLFAAAPFLGPTLGPVIGGFLAAAAGWRWVEGLLAVFSGVLWLCILLLLPETYSPVLLRRRAEKMSAMTGKVYRSQFDIDRGPAPLGKTLRTALSRPWILLFCEPIVLLFSIYMAIIYGTLYMLFAAYPIVFQDIRGWGEGIGGLAFLGILVGMIMAVMYKFPENFRYAKKCSQTTDRLAPELRLPPSMVGGIALPIGLFWFAWTNSPNIHWMASVAAGAPFGFGMVLVFLSVFNYLIDSYTILSASVLAANSTLRSLFGMAFPLFTTYIYHNLGIHWALSIPAFLALACVPFPFIFYKYGARIRQRCPYASEADAFMRRLAERNQATSREEPDSEKGEKLTSVTRGFDDVDSIDTDALSTDLSCGMVTRRASRASRQSGRSLHRVATAAQYEENPYDLDLIKTRQSAISCKD